MHISELETPAIVIDLDVMERNLRRVADYAREHSLRLRPHTKTHKIPALGKRQIDLGAVGLTVAKTTEGDVMTKSGTPDLLVAYPVIGDTKVKRLAALAESMEVTVALDSVEAAEALSRALPSGAKKIGALAEVDVGLHRVGVRPGEELVALTRHLASLPGLEYRGIAFYPGHIKQAEPEALDSLSSVLEQAIERLRREGLEPQIVSGGSTPTLFHSHRIRGLTEIRPGTYIFNDRNTWLTGGCDLADCAATILTTVVSTSVPGRMIIDGGSKTFSSDGFARKETPSFGHVQADPEAIFEKMNEEHGFFDMTRSTRKWKVGERVRILPNHICVAMNLHEQVYAVRGENVEEVWKVEARGKLQ